ncbi:MAG: SDR family oxidoreductase [Solirubrobacteraceae bacterium]|nr:SDR family oxidoreductase [Solirubrobacteraceae bacterium]
MTKTSELPTLSALTDLTGRTVVVTGGAMGIGRAIAGRMHEAGANVVIADVDPSVQEAVAGLNDDRRGSASAVIADLADPQGGTTAIDIAIDDFGAVDVLVNNAGIFPSVPFMEMSPAMLRHVLDVNLTGVFLASQAAASRMIARGAGGRILNITSIDALHPSMPGLAHYDASKHGVWGLTKSLALELAPHGIWVNAIAPGGIATPGVGDVDDERLQPFIDRIPMRRLGDPDEIARAALFLASDLASYVTGSQLVVDGGRLLA